MDKLIATAIEHAHPKGGSYNLTDGAGLYLYV